MKQKIIAIIGLVMIVISTSVSAFAGGALPGFTSAEPPVIDEIVDTDKTIHGTAPAEMTVVVKYKNGNKEISKEVVTDAEGKFSLEIEGKLSAKNKVSAYTVGLRTSACMADSNTVICDILPARITVKNLKARSRKLTITTYPKAKVRIRYKGFSKKITTNKKGKYVLKLTKKKQLKKGYTVKYNVIYNGLTGPTISKKI